MKIMLYDTKEHELLLIKEDTQNTITLVPNLDRYVFIGYCGDDVSDNDALNIGVIHNNTFAVMESDELVEEEKTNIVKHLKSICREINNNIEYRI